MEATTSSLGDVKDIQEIGITISAQNLNPAILNIDFLKSSGVVPSDWQLAKQPVLSPTRSQLSFQNGLNIVAQPRTITFAEALKVDGTGSASPVGLSAPQIAAKYAESLPHADYLGLSLTPRILVNFPSPDRTPREFLVGTLLAPGPWQQIGRAPAQASYNFVYVLERCQLTISLNEVRLRSKTDQQSIPAIMFAGSFNYGLSDLPDSERVGKLKEYVGAWTTDLEEFQEIVNQKFLGQEGGIGSAETIVPPGTVLSAS